MSKRQLPMDGETALFFGMVVRLTCDIEYILHRALAGILRVRDSDATVLITPMRYEQVRDLLLSFRNKWPDDKLDRLLKRVQTSRRLRNHICHSRWVDGKKEGSIKPLAAFGKGNLKLLGVRDNEKEYTTDDLVDEVSKLFDLKVELEDYVSIHKLDAVKTRKPRRKSV